MSCAAEYNFTVCKGKTFYLPLRWEALPVIYKTITGITQTAPMVVTCPSHGVPPEWRCAVTDVKGMTEANFGDPNSPKVKQFKRATVVDTDTLEFNDVDARSFKAYASGGILRYNTPVPITGYTATFLVKDKVGGTTLADWSADVSIDDVNYKILLTLTDTTTSALTWSKGLYEFVMTAPGGDVISLLMGTITVETEIVT